MKKGIIQCVFTLLVLGSLCCCSSDSYYDTYDDLVIEDENNRYKLEQLTFTLSLYNEVNGYVNSVSLDSIVLKVDAKDWGIYESEKRDTLGYTDRVVNGIKYSDKKIEYMVNAPYILAYEELTTAGDFVQYLKDRVVLTPGDYLCEIESLELQLVNGSSKRILVQEFNSLTVQENISSICLGEISINVD